MTTLQQSFLEQLAHQQIELTDMSGDPGLTIYYRFQDFPYVIKLKKTPKKGYIVSYITFSWELNSTNRPKFTYNDVNTNAFKRHVMESLERNKYIRLSLLFM